MVHGEPPGAAWLIKAGDDGASSGARSQEIARALGVAHRGRQADTSRIDARHGGETFDEAECLTTTIATQQGVNLINHDESQVAKETRDGRVLMQQQCFEGFGRDLQDAGGVLQQLALVRSGDVSVPVPYRDIGLVAQVV